MTVNFIETPGKTEPEITISADRLTPELEELIGKLSGIDLSPLTAYNGESAVLLERREIIRFFTDGKGVSVESEAGTFSIKKRLYELEAILGKSFVRISNSEIINVRHITAIDLSISGTVKLTLTGGRVSYSSRRYIKKLKEAVGL